MNLGDRNRSQRLDFKIVKRRFSLVKLPHRSFNLLLRQSAIKRRDFAAITPADWQYAVEKDCGGSL
ncbi:hypothetical protein ACNKHP_14060 [Shigella boydii]